ncbi:MAG: hypothetical protein IJ705_03675 [Oscillospiraceae bacterium]|nr:hypothetical protein [Oscillospiraceae bacterium]
MRRKHTGLWLLALLLALLALAGCGLSGGAQPAAESVPQSGGLAVVTLPPAEETETPVPSEETVAEETPAPTQSAVPEALPSPEPEEATPAPEERVTPAGVSEDGEYTSPEDVAEYLHRYGRLPSNFITKNEARDLGWPGGNLWKYAPGKSIGGDRFGNYEGLLPKGRYRECDVNYAGGSRGAERIIYGEDGSIWYTDDHYESFTRLY